MLRFIFALVSSLLLISCGDIGGIPDPVVVANPQPSAVARKPLGLEVHQMFIPKGVNARHRVKGMNPSYITIHSTQNRARSANAYMHAKGLYNGNFLGKHNSLGYLSWHFTVDDRRIYQSLPTSEQGQHADYEGPGNRKSIGIEICENRGNSRTRTLDRTARLTAVLMKEHGIWISHVVPHQHWRMKRYSDGCDLGHKNCPHFLMDRGKPGKRWRRFQALVMHYYRRL